jgi:hypothetical protein
MGKKVSKYCVIRAILRINFDCAAAALKVIYEKLFGNRGGRVGPKGAIKSLNQACVLTD